MAVTSTPANSAIDICARALILIGAEPITSFDDGNNEALVASNVYEDIARATLTSTRWRFATNQAILNRLTDPPTGRYDAAYQLPDGWLMTHAVTVNDVAIEYQTYGDKIFANTASGAFTITLPAAPIVGDEVRFVDLANSFDTNNLTVGRNSLKIDGQTSDLTVATEGAAFSLVYSGATYGWKLTEK